MLVSLNWLREYVDLSPDLDVDDLVTRLTMASAEVEGIHRIGGWDRDLVRVGAVIAVDPHPRADRLRIATVDYGGAEPQQVVCGAPNVAAGQRVAFAREGARLHDGHSGELSTLKRSRIRGVESAGMVLSERELGLSDQHEGIIELPADAPIGMPLADYIGDVVLDVHTWPNRADTMCMLGIAREVAAIVGAAWRAPGESYSEDGASVTDAVSVRIEDPGMCARYIATVVEGVSVGPSPAWLRERLRAAGQRPINNVVDITNYVMLELGQPLHAFDLAKLRGTVAIRPARDGERLRTLDGEDRELSAGTLLIADDSGPIALAGVMGGEATEVTEGTTAILLEAARFDPVSVRRTSTRLRLRSEASSRFERGLSPELALHASRRATKLFIEVCGGVARQGMVDIYPRPHVAPSVTLTRRRLDAVLGFSVPAADVEAGLRALGFEVSAGDERFEVRAPWWRTDIAIPDDIAEEVLRIAGYDRLPASMLVGEIPRHEPQPPIELRERLCDALAAAGLQEVITYSLTTGDVLRRVIPAEAIEEKPPLRLLNTLSSEHESLRPTLRHSILETVARNIRAGAQRIAIFEAGRAYLPRYNEGEGGPLPDEREQIAGAITGLDTDRWGSPTERRLDFFDAKGMLDAAIAGLGLRLEYLPDNEEFGLLSGRTARLSIAGQEAGLLGEVHPHVLGLFGIGQPVILFEIDLALLAPHIAGRFKAASPPRFPAVEQDLAVVVDEDVSAGTLRAAIQASKLVASVRVFDVYRGEQLPAGKKSVAFAIRYQASDRTLTTEDANREQSRIVGRLGREFGASPRA